jgi:hypothetical protein
MIENRFRIQHREGGMVPLPEIRGRRISGGAFVNENHFPVEHDLTGTN